MIVSTIILSLLKGQAVKKNTIVEVEAIEYTNNGIPRLKTKQGI